MHRAVTVTSQTVAVVEDDPDVAMLVADVMDGVEHFVTGEDAVARLTEGTHQPSFILLDLELPGMDGLEVLRRLRAHPKTRRTPVVIFTGTDFDPDQGYRLGANAWVRKPRDVDALEEALRSIRSFWSQWNER